MPTIQPSNFNFQPRTTPIASGFGATNMYSEVDFDRADTDIEDDDHSSYSEVEVTDDEAMKK